MRFDDHIEKVRLVKISPGRSLIDIRYPAYWRAREKIANSCAQVIQSIAKIGAKRNVHRVNHAISNRSDIPAGLWLFTALSSIQPIMVRILILVIEQAV